MHQHHSFSVGGEIEGAMLTPKQRYCAAPLSKYIGQYVIRVRFADTDVALCGMNAAMTQKSGYQQDVSGVVIQRGGIASPEGMNSQAGIQARSLFPMIEACLNLTWRQRAFRISAVEQKLRAVLAKSYPKFLDMSS